MPKAPGRATPSNNKAHPPWLGGAAGMMSVCFTHPIDLTKIRRQVQQPPQSMAATFARTARTSGIRGLWTGLSASLLRQVSYGGARFGVYNWLKDWGAPVVTSRSALVGHAAAAGLIAGFIGCPADLVMVRLCSDGVKPPEKQLHYRNAIQALYRVARDEGAASLFRGWQATVVRSVLLNASQLSFYDIFKDELLRLGYEDGIPLQFITAVGAGTVSVTACAPADVIKSRIQSSTTTAGTISIVAQSLKREGVRVLFRGWLPAWLKMAPTIALTFVFFEQLKLIF